MLPAADQERVIFRVDNSPGGPLALVCSDYDETLSIRHDGQLVAGCFWRVSEMDKAVDEFRHFARAARRELRPTHG